MWPKITLAILAVLLSKGGLAEAAPHPLEIESNSQPMLGSGNGQPWAMESTLPVETWPSSNSLQPGPSFGNPAPLQHGKNQAGSDLDSIIQPQNWPTPNPESKLVQNQPSTPAPAVPSSPLLPPTMVPRPPLQDAAYGLLGWETATPIGKDRLLIQFGGSSFNNPKDFRNATSPNRSNDAHLDLVYGISNDFQITASLSGKDDTIFQDLVNNGSQIQVISNIIPLQAKWRFYNGDRLQVSTVLGVEFPDPVAALFFRSGKSILYSQPAANGNGQDSIFVQDTSIVLGLGLPISYQATENLRLHLNPRVGFFPSQLGVTTTTGDPNGIVNGGIGFNGTQLKYHGTVFGIGLGASYSLSPKLQIAADFTPILAGTNSIDRANGNSLLTARPVWNMGLQYTPNDRSTLGLYATNRFSATTSGPSNLLVQPGNDFAVGLNVSYLTGNTGEAPGEKRSTYPNQSAFWAGAGGYPSTTLPSNSILYQLGLGNREQFNLGVRYGLTDDLELAISYNNANRLEMPVETSLMGRWGLVPDRGQEGISGALGLGLLRIETPGSDTQLGYSLYAETPISYRLPGGKLSVQATPKLIIPAQFQGVPRTLAVSLGADYQIFSNTQLFGSITPSIFGDNQLVTGNTLAFRGSTPVYNLGMRQLFPSGNSTYGVELYYTNGAGSTGYQSTSALPNGDTQFGLRFSILNGTP
jgi:hypothetical protein